MKNALAYYNAGVVVVNSEVVGLALDLKSQQDLSCIKYKLKVRIFPRRQFLWAEK
jgi:hypothetical protein